MASLLESFTASTKDLLIRRIALEVYSMLFSVAPFDQNDSTAWDKASIPVHAATYLGILNDNTGSITLKGVSDSSSVSLSAIDEAADDGRPVVDLSSGSVTAAEAGEVFEYSVKFINGIPVATDGEVTIDGFDAKVDRLVIKSDSLPSGYGKESLLNTAGVDVTTDTSGGTRIDFGTNADGNSGYIVLNGVSDSDLSSIDLIFEIVSPTVVGTQVDIDSAAVTASSDAETFVYDANWDGVVEGARQGINSINRLVSYEKILLNEQEDASAWWNGLYIVVLNV